MADAALRFRREVENQVLRRVFVRACEGSVERVMHNGKVVVMVLADRYDELVAAETTLKDRDYE